MTSSDGSDVEPLILGLCADDVDFLCGKHQVRGRLRRPVQGPDLQATAPASARVRSKASAPASASTGHGGGGHHDDDDHHGGNGGGGWNNGGGNHGGGGGWWHDKGWGGKSYAGAGSGAASVQASIKALPTTGAGNGAGNSSELMLLGVVGLLGIAGLSLRKRVVLDPQRISPARRG